MAQPPYIFKMAAEPEEMEQIHQLNYQTFVEEIPQHHQNKNRRLIDRFNHENIYFIAKDGDKLIGMIAVRANRPFSLDQKLLNLDDYLPDNANPCEVRLLAVKKEYRKTSIFYGLVNQLVRYCLQNNYDLALISGTERQIVLYKKIGFEPFAHPVGTELARYYPMYLTREKFATTSKVFSRLMMHKEKPQGSLHFLPGPVQVNQNVVQAFGKTAISHRSHAFQMEMEAVRKGLCKLTGATHAQIVVGTGTLANDLVAAQIKQISGKGLVLANGEFGCRLLDHAARFDLQHETIEKKWNEPITVEEIAHYLALHQDIKWLWTVHCETSTGYLYDLPGIVELTKTYQIRLCVDACSSVGSVPVDLSDVYLASTVSGKGLGSYPGLAIVFHQEKIVPNREIPRYLDLGQYAQENSIPYTHSSNLVFALHKAIKNVTLEKRYPLAAAARKMLRDAGFDVLGNGKYSPGILTVALPDFIPSQEVGDKLRESGILISYESDYLLRRNWIQFAFMGELTIADFKQAFSVLQQIIQGGM